MRKIMPNALALPTDTEHLVVALAYDGLCTFEFGLAVEVFGLPRPEMGANWYRFAVAGVEGGELRATGGVRLVVDGGMELLQQADTIIVPGWRGADEAVPRTLCDALATAHRRGARVLSICSGVFVLAAAGLLDGKRATTHWRYTDRLRTSHPGIEVTPDVLYVDEGSVLTSAGSAAGLDLCLHLIRRDFGAAAANMVARRLVVPPHRDGGQTQFIAQAVPVLYESDRLGPLIDDVRASLNKEHTVATLAKRAGMSERTFLRRFEAATGMTPAKWLLTERLSRARDLLENSTLTVEQVAQQTGFNSTATIRHHFRNQLFTTPASYRKAFARQAGRS
ncbi:transcriptional activator FtrA [Bradyrhizobium lupini HPC(L)]|uniref:Transcriptional activator FtrA n=1 Tax=Bradyrhizobium lupini HPC(L) TaxID=1229491 RepID=A0ABP2RPW6_RHILU|nr:transcriptional activator FtrA [Bradyrhizobium lupini HPC(L)]